ncbi:MAG: tRNA pseudouridine(13) synthase TruD [Saccharospirillum sp.]|nr:tRNA pseudouridine(13) synthase TruD [Saccharospirillum sp.]
MTRFDLNFPTAWGARLGSAGLKQSPEDFQVVEVLPESPQGEGEHLWLTLEKTGQNTVWIARKLAQWAGIPQRAVSYAGLKDRHGVTQQTFSLHLMKQSPPEGPFVMDGVAELARCRHSKKLRTGQLIGNQFRVRLRDYDGDQTAFEQRWQCLVERGFPNYFGLQRFGHGGANLDRAERWLAGQLKLPRPQQSMHLSAMRSWLFNAQLAKRVREGNWNRLLPGDFAQFREGRGGFWCQDEDLADARVASGDLSPTASLPGETRDDSPDFMARQSEALAQYNDLVDALKARRVDRALRKLRVFPEKAQLEWEGTDPILHFFLPAGSYATALLFECVAVTEPVNQSGQAQTDED